MSSTLRDRGRLLCENLNQLRQDLEESKLAEQAAAITVNKAVEALIALAHKHDLL